MLISRPWIMRLLRHLNRLEKKKIYHDRLSLLLKKTSSLFVISPIGVYFSFHCCTLFLQYVPWIDFLRKIVTWIVVVYSISCFNCGTILYTKHYSSNYIDSKSSYTFTSSFNSSKCHIILILTIMMIQEIWISFIIQITNQMIDFITSTS